MFGIDITDRIRPYIEGTCINAPKVKIPKGDNDFEVRIQDIVQMQSNQLISIQVQ